MSDETLRIEGLADDHEAKYPEGGLQHDLVVSGSEIVTYEGKDGKPDSTAWKLTLRKTGAGAEAYSSVSSNLFFPGPEDTAEAKAYKRRDLKRAAVVLFGPDSVAAFASNPMDFVPRAVGKQVNLRIDIVERKKGARAGESFPEVRWPKFE